MNEASDSGDGAGILLERIVGFQAFLRAHGYSAGVPETIDALRVAETFEATNRRRLRAGLRSLLCSGKRDWARFDDLFDRYWLPPNRRVLRESSGPDDESGSAQVPGDDASKKLLEDVRQGGGDAHRVGGGNAVQGGASASESLEKRDFRFLTRDEELQAVERLADRLAARMRRRVARRQRIAAVGTRLNLRRTIRQSLQYGGMPISLRFQRRRRKPPHLVLLLDVSRSMSIYTYMLLRFTRAIVRGFRRADAFVFHTRLVPVSEALLEKNMAHMRDRLSLISAGWSGGTRIGESLATFNQRYLAKLVNRRSVVIIISDGFDTGDPAQLSGQMRALHSRARRVVWLNPLLGRDGYRPVSAGMCAALPHVDLFLPAHNLDSLLALETELARL